MILRTAYCAAQPFSSFIRDARTNAVLWYALARRAYVSPAMVERVQSIDGRWHLLVLAEDWCGDAVNSLPVLARLAESADNVDLRVLPRDTYPELMDAHRSPRGARAIPVVILLDNDYTERAWWGSRPIELQRWIDEVGDSMDKEERYREARRWYARDRGASMLNEVIGLLAAAASDRRAA